MHRGAADFLTEPVNEQLLLEKLHTAIEISKCERAQYNRRSTVQARLDLLSEREKQT